MSFQHFLPEKVGRHGLQFPHQETEAETKGSSFLGIADAELGALGYVSGRT